MDIPFELLSTVSGIYHDARLVAGLPSSEGCSYVDPARAFGPMHTILAPKRSVIRVNFYERLQLLRTLGSLNN